jgi:hypothetical protein
MQCKIVQKSLSHYANQELPETEREKIAAHLQSCAGCRALAAEYAQLAGLAKQLPEITPPQHVMAEVRAGVRERISGKTEVPHQKPRQGNRIFSWFATPRYAVALGSAVVLLIAFLAWLGSEWETKPARRTLASYLAQRDYFALWLALKKPDEQKRLLDDSVSVDLLLQTIDRYDEIQKRYGRFRSASVSFASVLSPSGEAGIVDHYLTSKKISPVVRQVARNRIQNIAQNGKKITLKKLFKALKTSRWLLRQYQKKGGLK